MMSRESGLYRFWNDYSRNRVAVVSVVIILVLVGLALSAPLIMPQDPYDLSHLVLRDARRPPGYVGTGGYTHWLGTDAQGRRRRRAAGGRGGADAQGRRAGSRRLKKQHAHGRADLREASDG